jgi:hypothetical protein
VAPQLRARAVIKARRRFLCRRRAATIGVLKNGRAIPGSNPFSVGAGGAKMWAEVWLIFKHDQSRVSGIMERDDAPPRIAPRAGVLRFMGGAGGASLVACYIFIADTLYYQHTRT